MRFLCTSDWHADAVTLGASRFADVERAVEQSVRHAIECEVDAYIFGGDLADPDIGSGATIKAVELACRTALTLRDAGIRSVWIAGNHDTVEDGSGVTLLEPLKSLDGLRIVVADQPTFDRPSAMGGIALACFPYPTLARPYDPAAWARDLPWGDVPIVTLSHLAVPGIVPGEETTDMPRGRDVVFPMEETRRALLRVQGHYHRAHTFEGGGPPIHVIGSICRLTFGEEKHVPSMFSFEV